MLPILYPSDNLYYFRLGKGKLGDILSCVVHEELNGDYSLEFKYPITGKALSDIYGGGTVMAQAPHYSEDASGAWQIVGEMFDIYSVSLPIDGVVTVKCRHVSRRLAKSVFIGTRLANLLTDARPVPNDGTVQFLFGSTQYPPAESPTITFDTPRSLLSILVGAENSYVSNGIDIAFTCETNSTSSTWSGLPIRIYRLAHRGLDRGAEVRFGFNMTDIDRTTDSTGTFNAYVPFWKADEQSAPVYASGYIVQPTTPVTPVVAVPLDLSSEFETQPTSAQMTTYARNLLDSTMPWLGSDTLTADFVNGVEIDPHGTPIYLGDTVHVYWGEAQVSRDLRVVAYDYDVLAERYIKMELGTQEKEFVATTEDYSGSSGGSSGGGSTGSPVAIMTANLPLSWTDSGSGYYTCTPTLSGAFSSESKIDLQPSKAQTIQLQSDGVTALYIENNAGTLTAYAVGNAPTVALTMQCSVEVTDALSTVLGDTVGVAANLKLNTRYAPTVTLRNCTGTISNNLFIHRNSDGTVFMLYGRLAITGYSRTGSNPGVNITLGFPIKNPQNIYVGFRGESPREYVLLGEASSGVCALFTSESYSNATGTTLTLMVPCSTIFNY